MSVAVEKLNNNEVKITMTISPEIFEKGMQHAYNSNKGKVNVPGFRKGKVPRQMIEKMYGKEFLYEDAINYALPEVYEAAIAENNLEPVSRPKITVENVDAEKGATITAEIFVKPEVAVANYKGLTYKKPVSEVADKEIDDEIDKIREKNSRVVTVTDRPIENGDIAIVDFEGFMDEVAFEGGKGTDYELVIGSHTFIDTFEEQLIGLNVNDFKEVNVNFPEDYGNAELKGKPAKFNVTVKEIKVKELPEVDDEFAQDVSEFDTLDEYKNDFRAKIQDRKQREAEFEVENQIVDELIKVTTMDIPEVMIETESENMVRDFEQRLKSQGMNLELYMQYTGMTIEQMKQANQEPARKRVEGRLALEAVVKAENFEISEEEFDEEIDRMAKAYRMEKDKLKEVLREEDKKGLETDLKVKKALKLIVDSAVEVQ